MLATDLDVRWLEQQPHDPNVELRRHNVADDPLPEQSFDLVHERLVLLHVPQHVTALGRLVSALRPGGWLLAEDFSSGVAPDWFVDPVSADEHLGNRIVQEMRALLVQRGADPALGHKLPRLLREAGLQDVDADAYQAVEGGTRCAGCSAPTSHKSPTCSSSREGSRETTSRTLRLLETGELSPSSPLMVSAWGRRGGR